MFCHVCGANITQDSKFCKECGNKIGISINTGALTTQDLEPVADKVNQDRLSKLLEMAFWHNDIGNMDAAIKACDAALVINPSSTTAHSLLATLYEKKGEDQKAIEHLEAVLALNPESTADMAKLDQLRRGVHVKSIQPPPAYRWVPPALINSSFGHWCNEIATNLNSKKVGNIPLMPLVYSSAACIIVLGTGLMMLKPSANNKVMAGTPRTYEPSTNRVAYNTPGNNATSYTPQPATGVTIPPPNNSKQATPKNIQDSIKNTPDPFASNSIVGKERPLYPGEDIPGVPHSTSGSSDGTKALPPLKLQVIPTGNQGSLPPAPITIPATGNNPGVTTTSLPTHTVMVSDLNNQANAQNSQPQQAQSNSGNQQTTQKNPDNGAPEAAPVVRITVHDSSKNGDDSDINQGSSPSSRQVVVNNDEARAFQQYALSLQQHGDYKGAKAAYEKAIKTYNARIKSGVNKDEAVKGLRACQTGLEICNQSLQ